MRIKLTTTEAILLKELLSAHKELISSEMNADQTLVMKSASQEVVIVDALATKVEALLETTEQDHDE